MRTLEVTSLNLEAFRYRHEECTASRPTPRTVANRQDCRRLCRARNSHEQALAYFYSRENDADARQFKELTTPSRLAVFDHHHNYHNERQRANKLVIATFAEIFLSLPSYHHQIEKSRTIKISHRGKSDPEHTQRRVLIAPDFPPALAPTRSRCHVDHAIHYYLRDRCRCSKLGRAVRV